MTFFYLPKEAFDLFYPGLYLTVEMQNRPSTVYRVKMEDIKSKDFKVPLTSVYQGSSNDHHGFTNLNCAKESILSGNLQTQPRSSSLNRQRTIKSKYSRKINKNTDKES